MRPCASFPRETSFKLIQPSSGLDVSDKMREFSRGFLDGLEEVDGFILKNRSPSCGFTDVKVYSGPEKGAAIGKTAGFFGGAVRVYASTTLSTRIARPLSTASCTKSSAHS